MWKEDIIMEFYDCHAHQIGKQKGGLIIAIENECVGKMPVFSNAEIRNLEVPDGFVKVEYVTKNFDWTNSAVVKYHPRYEKYTSLQVIHDLKERKPKAVVIDTLNEPNWTPNDYWMVARSFPKIQFLFSHSGGYDINKFMEMCHFSKNIWIDFSYIQNYFGIVGSKSKYWLIEDTMRYALNSDFKDKILFGTDYPEFSQALALEWYDNNGYVDKLNHNFERFYDLCK